MDETATYDERNHPRRRATDHTDRKPVTTADIEEMMVRLRPDPPPPPSRVTLVLDRFILPAFGILALGFIAVTAFSLIQIDERNPEDVVVVSYGIQHIEEFVQADESGRYIIPTVEDFEGPAICLSRETVPVRSVLTTTQVDGLAEIPVVGTLYWQEEPPGRSFPLEAGRPGVLPSNVSITRNFENPIPEKVAGAVRDSPDGALQFSIRGDVDVLVPGVLDAAWTTEEFWLVDCDGRSEADG